jgi:preprotein translocase subunit SecF
MYFFGFSNNRVVSIFMLLAILVISLAMSAYLPILEGIDETGGANATADATAANANATTGETDINKIIAQINAQSLNPTEPVDKKATAGIVLNDKYTEQTIDAEALSKLLKNSTQVQAIMNPILPPSV